MSPSTLVNSGAVIVQEGHVFGCSLANACGSPSLLGSRVWNMMSNIYDFSGEDINTALEVLVEDVLKKHVVRFDSDTTNLGLPMEWKELDLSSVHWIYFLTPTKMHVYRRWVSDNEQPSAIIKEAFGYLGSSICLVEKREFYTFGFMEIATVRWDFSKSPDFNLLDLDESQKDIERGNALLTRAKLKASESHRKIEELSNLIQKLDIENQPAVPKDFKWMDFVNGLFKGASWEKES